MKAATGTVEVQNLVFSRWIEVKHKAEPHNYIEFFLVTDTGNEILAISAEDHGNSHYVYQSTGTFAKYGTLNSKNRADTISWLEMLIKDSQLKVDHQLAAEVAHAGEPTPDNPLGLYYTQHKVEKVANADGTHTQRFFLLDQYGTWHLAVVGEERETRDGHYVYKATEEFSLRYPLSCHAQKDVIHWLEQRVTHNLTPSLPGASAASHRRPDAGSGTVSGTSAGATAPAASGPGAGAPSGGSGAEAWGPSGGLVGGGVGSGYAGGAATPTSGMEGAASGGGDSAGSLPPPPPGSLSLRQLTPPPPSPAGAPYANHQSTPPPPPLQQQRMAGLSGFPGAAAAGAASGIPQPQQEQEQQQEQSLGLAGYQGPMAMQTDGGHIQEETDRPQPPGAAAAAAATAAVQPVAGTPPAPPQPPASSPGPSHSYPATNQASVLPPPAPAPAPSQHQESGQAPLYTPPRLHQEPQPQRQQQSQQQPQQLQQNQQPQNGVPNSGPGSYQHLQQPQQQQHDEATAPAAAAAQQQQQQQQHIHGCPAVPTTTLQPGQQGVNASQQHQQQLPLPGGGASLLPQQQGPLQAPPQGPLQGLQQGPAGCQLVLPSEPPGLAQLLAGLAASMPVCSGAPPPQLASSGPPLQLQLPLPPQLQLQGSNTAQLAPPPQPQQQQALPQLQPLQHHHHQPLQQFMMPGLFQQPQQQQKQQLPFPPLDNQAQQQHLQMLQQQLQQRQQELQQLLQSNAAALGLNSPAGVQQQPQCTGLPNAVATAAAAGQQLLLSGAPLQLPNAALQSIPELSGGTQAGNTGNRGSSTAQRPHEAAATLIPSSVQAGIRSFALQGLAQPQDAGPAPAAAETGQSALVIPATISSLPGFALGPPAGQLAVAVAGTRTSLGVAAGSGTGSGRTAANGVSAGGGGGAISATGLHGPEQVGCSGGGGVGPGLFGWPAGLAGGAPAGASLGLSVGNLLLAPHPGPHMQLPLQHLPLPAQPPQLLQPGFGQVDGGTVGKGLQGAAAAAGCGGSYGGVDGLDGGAGGSGGCGGTTSPSALMVHPGGSSAAAAANMNAAAPSAGPAGTATGMAVGAPSGLLSQPFTPAVGGQSAAPGCGLTSAGRTAKETTPCPATTGPSGSGHPHGGGRGSGGGGGGSRGSGGKHKLAGVAEVAHKRKLARLAAAGEEAVRQAQGAYLAALRHQALSEAAQQEALRKTIASWVRGQISDDEVSISGWHESLEQMLQDANRSRTISVPFLANERLLEATRNSVEAITLAAAVSLSSPYDSAAVPCVAPTTQAVVPPPPSLPLSPILAPPPPAPIAAAGVTPDAAAPIPAPASACDGGGCAARAAPAAAAPAAAATQPAATTTMTTTTVPSTAETMAAVSSLKALLMGGLEAAVLGAAADVSTSGPIHGSQQPPTASVVAAAAAAAAAAVGNGNTGPSSPVAMDVDGPAPVVGQGGVGSSARHSGQQSSPTLLVTDGAAALLSSAAAGTCAAHPGPAAPCGIAGHQGQQFPAAAAAAAAPLLPPLVVPQVGTGSTGADLSPAHPRFNTPPESTAVADLPLLHPPPPPPSPPPQGPSGPPLAAVQEQQQQRPLQLPIIPTRPTGPVGAGAVLACAGSAKSWSFSDPHLNKHGVRVALESLREISALCPPVANMASNDLVDTVKKFESHPHPSVSGLAKAILTRWRGTFIHRLRSMSDSRCYQDPVAALEHKIQANEIAFPNVNELLGLPRGAAAAAPGTTAEGAAVSTAAAAATAPPLPAPAAPAGLYTPLTAANANGAGSFGVVGCTTPYSLAATPAATPVGEGRQLACLLMTPPLTLTAGGATAVTSPAGALCGGITPAGGPATTTSTAEIAQRGLFDAAAGPGTSAAAPAFTPQLFSRHGGPAMSPALLSPRLAAPEMTPLLGQQPSVPVFPALPPPASSLPPSLQQPLLAVTMQPHRAAPASATPSKAAAAASASTATEAATSLAPPSPSPSHRQLATLGRTPVQMPSPRQPPPPLLPPSPAEMASVTAAGGAPAAATPTASLEATPSTAPPPSRSPTVKTVAPALAAQLQRPPPPSRFTSAADATAGGAASVALLSFAPSSHLISSSPLLPEATTADVAALLATSAQSLVAHMQICIAAATASGGGSGGGAPPPPPPPSISFTHLNHLVTLASTAQVYAAALKTSDAAGAAAAWQSLVKQLRQAQALNLGTGHGQLGGVSQWPLFIQPPSTSAMAAGDGGVTPGAAWPAVNWATSWPLLPPPAPQATPALTQPLHIRPLQLPALPQSPLPVIAATTATAAATATAKTASSVATGAPDTSSGAQLAAADQSGVGPTCQEGGARGAREGGSGAAAPSGGDTEMGY